MVMAEDPLETAIDNILAEADGDARVALRAVLKNYVQLEAELRHLYAVAEHGKPESKLSLH
jgi:hypothetical protein